MNFKDAYEAVSLVIESNDVPLIIGHSGIGKTSLVKKLADDNNYMLVTIDANLLKEGEIGGLPMIENGVTVYAVHSKLRKTSELLKSSDKDLILFIDELNRCDHAVAQELMNLILNREINGYVLSDRVKVIAAMNPSNRNDGFYDTSYEVSDLDPAQEDRFVFIRLDSDVHEWIKWAMSGSGNIDLDIIEFISNFPDYLNKPTIEETIKPTPRSWERVSKSYKVYKNSEKKYSFDTFLNTVKGNVGVSIANDLATFLMNLKKPFVTAKKIFKYGVISDDLKNMLLKESHSRLYILFKDSVKYLMENGASSDYKLFSELLDCYPRDLRLGIMKEIKRDYTFLYNKLLDEDRFIESFFNIYK
ncbi:AAA family ATPase [Clostridium sp. BJN0001]|uniref:AAA family ATPase n=1 Tax=Clostridium sp. BJN0001 TaxID=2930219 RepID=UPI001FD0222E|nr:AAA family ATPase [Clostridium sp. BJN0001]